MELTLKLHSIREELQLYANPKKGKFHQGFFKTQKGGYGEGDIFLGVSVPDMRKIANRLVKSSVFTNELLLQISEKLLQSEIHEERFLSLQILKLLYHKVYNLRKKIIEMYLRNMKYVNNRDLVDTSAYLLLGDWCLKNQYEYKIVDLTSLSCGKGETKRDILWRRRIAMVSTMIFLRSEKFALCLDIAEVLLKQQIDIDPKMERGGREGRELTNKAVGRLLRELGKRNDDLLRTFLRKYSDTMPRTMLRYCIEKMTREEKDYRMKNTTMITRDLQQKKKKQQEQEKQENDGEIIHQWEQSLTENQQSIVSALRQLFAHIKSTEVRQWNTIVRKLHNKTWWYITAKENYIILGYGKRKKLETINPMISGLWDESLKTVGKLYLHGVDDINQKGVSALISMSNLG